MTQAGLILLLVLALSASSFAGEIYGNIGDGAKPIAGARIEVLSPKRPSAVSDASGGYRIFIPEEGRFQLRVLYGGQASTITVYSYQRAVRYVWCWNREGGRPP